MTPTVLVFVVEDDAIIQSVLKETLEDAGFEVTLASSGEEAIEMLEEHVPQFGSLITDVNLVPGKLTGWDVAKRARELKSEIPVVYMTGASANEWTSHGVPNSVLLTKPFAPAQVVIAVSQLLNEAARIQALVEPKE